MNKERKELKMGEIKNKRIFLRLFVQNEHIRPTKVDLSNHFRIDFDQFSFRCKEPWYFDEIIKSNDFFKQAESRFMDSLIQYLKNFLNNHQLRGEINIQTKKIILPEPKPGFEFNEFDYYSYFCRNNKLNNFEDNFEVELLNQVKEAIKKRNSARCIWHSYSSLLHNLVLEYASKIASGKNLLEIHPEIAFPQTNEHQVICQFFEESIHKLVCQYFIIMLCTQIPSKDMINPEELYDWGKQLLPECNLFLNPNHSLGRISFEHLKAIMTSQLSLPDKIKRLQLLADLIKLNLLQSVQCEDKKNQIEVPELLQLPENHSAWQAIYSLLSLNKPIL